MRRVPFYWFLCWLALLPTGANSQDFTVNAAVSSDSVTEGEPFQYQLQVSGSETPEPPDLSAITDFTVTTLGSGSNSSSSVTIINGKVSQDVRKGYIFNYQLVAKKTGTLTIPPITVKDGAQSATTQPIAITVGQAQESDDFKLRVALSKADAWVGEAITLDLTFYYKSSLEQPQLNLPIANDPSFTVHEVEVQATNETAMLDGQQYQTMKARRILIPNKAGTFRLEPATLSFRGVAGYRVQQDLFFGRQQVPQFRHFVVPSNALDLTVRELPTAGKPANFADHVGTYRVDSRATPQKVNVGDPITLTVTISGPAFLKGIDLPPLQRQTDLAKNFRLPAERSPGQVQGNSIVFTQTIRAAREDVSEVPGIELPYFDPGSGTYQIARSQPIPLDVSETRVVTAQDAEGTEPVKPVTAEVEAWSRGIAHNYEDAGALRSQRFSPGAWLRSGSFWSLLLLPPLLYGLLWFFVRKHRTLQSDPDGVRQAQALRKFQEKITLATTSDQVLEALRGYIGDRLRLAAGALTAKDLREPLKRFGVAEETIAAAEDLFRRCEASRYSGGQSGNAGELADASRQVVTGIESRVQPAGLAWLDVAALRRLPGVSRFFPLLVLFVSLSGIAGAALDSTSRQEIFEEANSLFRQANEQSASDPDKARETYAKAILRFERLIREGGIENGKLYYNIGNAHFRARDIGRAIVNYRRAYDLMPHDANLVQNLEFARSRRIDRIEVPAKRKVAETLFFWHYDLPPAVKASLFGWAVLVAWGAAAVLLFRRENWLPWLTGGGAAVALLMLISLNLDAQAAAKIREGVIVAGDVMARKGDSDTYEPSFKEPLHAGTEFRILEERAGWIHAELGDGRSCWLPAKAMERIW
jgi:tetratricopeptide (TPR) repeat protein